MQQQEGNAKKKYEKPEAKSFPLRPSEAVLGSCKTAGGSGPSAASNCNSFGVCKVPGS